MTITGGLTLNPGETLTVNPGTGWGTGTYVLATYGSLTNNSSNFSGWTVSWQQPGRLYRIVFPPLRA